MTDCLRKSILVVNPNSTESMTSSLKPLVESLGSKNTTHTFFTAPPTSPSSINDSETLALSTIHTLPSVLPLLPSHHGVLIACYSSHPLVPLLRKHTLLPVVGIFEASICTALLLLRDDEEWGIVSTGKVWEKLLSSGVESFLGLGSLESTVAVGKFAGVQTTGLSATELHDRDPLEVRQRIIDATRRLVRRKEGRKGVGVVCLGCAGMVGMEEIVREACVMELGVEEGGLVRIVDSVKAGLGMLESLVLGHF